MVRLGQVGEKMLRTMGISLMTFSEPHSLSVTYSIDFLTSLKLVNFFFFPPS